MRLMVTIQVVKNGYLVSYFKKNKPVQSQNNIPSEVSNFVPLSNPSLIDAGIPQAMPQVVEESIIVNNEEDIVNILREIRASITD